MFVCYGRRCPSNRIDWRVGLARKKKKRFLGACWSVDHCLRMRVEWMNEWMDGHNVWWWSCRWYRINQQPHTRCSLISHQIHSKSRVSGSPIETAHRMHLETRECLDHIHPLLISNHLSRRMTDWLTRPCSKHTMAFSLASLALLLLLLGLDTTVKKDRRLETLLVTCRFDSIRPLAILSMLVPPREGEGGVAHELQRHEHSIKEPPPGLA